MLFIAFRQLILQLKLSRIHFMALIYAKQVKVLLKVKNF